MVATRITLPTWEEVPTHTIPHKITTIHCTETETVLIFILVLLRILLEILPRVLIIAASEEEVVAAVVYGIGHAVAVVVQVIMDEICHHLTTLVAQIIVIEVAMVSFVGVTSTKKIVQNG